MYNFKFADIGEGIHEGKLLKWLFKKGDTVHEGDTLCIIETDKVNAEIPSPVSGVLVELGGKVGDVIHVGDMLVIINEGKDTPIVQKTPISESETLETAGVVGEIEVSSDVIASSVEAEPPQSLQPSKVLASPLARKLASDHAIDLLKIKGTGDFGRILQSDVESSMKGRSIPVQPPVSFVIEPPISTIASSQGIKRVPITSIRKAIVKAMTQSKAIIPHTVLMDEINVSELVAFRNAQKPLAESLGIKLTYLPFIIKAVTTTLKEFPLFNASFDSDAGEILYKEFINLGIAVDTPEGLVVPNLKSADQFSIFELAKRLDALVKASLERTLQLKDIQNGTFTITNYGAFDATFGTPIIKHPEVAILGVGKIAKKPIVQNDEIIIAEMMPISLAVDHRIIDGADAGRFAMRLKYYLTHPMLLLLS